MQCKATLNKAKHLGLMYSVTYVSFLSIDWILAGHARKEKLVLIFPQCEADNKNITCESLKSPLFVLVLDNLPSEKIRMHFIHESDNGLDSIIFSRIILEDI